MLFSWVLFRADNLTAALHYFGAMFGLLSPAAASALLAAELYTPLSVLTMGLCALLVFQPARAHDWSVKPQTWLRFAMLAPLFIFSLLVMFSQSFNPFLYFQF
jgi:alginate O-acetyltransferase complex protein AlgI